MMRWLFSLTLGLGLLTFLGCGTDKTEEQKTTKTTAENQNEDKENHEHPEEGPHGGSLIELGEEQYHAEMVVDKEAGKVTIYILDDHAEKAVPIEATEVTITEMSEEHKLQAMPAEDDPEGKSSVFVSEDKELAEHLSGHVHARLLVKINDQSFNGKIDSH